MTTFRYEAPKLTIESSYPLPLQGLTDEWGLELLSAIREVEYVFATSMNIDVEHITIRL